MKIAIIIVALLAMGACSLVVGRREEPDELNDVNNTFDTNDIVWQSNLTVPIGKSIWLQISYPDANSVNEAISELRRMDTRNAKEAIDLEVTIGDETHTATFEDLFEWMGFTNEPNEPTEPNEPNIITWDVNDSNIYFTYDADAAEKWWISEPFNSITILLDTNRITDPFTLTIDGVDREFAHEEFRRRLGFMNEPNKSAEPLLRFNAEESPQEVIALGVGEDGKLFVEGNLGEGAKLFFENIVKPMADEYIRENCPQ